MRLYIDSCALSRLWDKYLSNEIIQEAKAMEVILQLISDGKLELVDSAVLTFESEKVPDSEKQDRINAILENAQYFVKVDDTIEEKAEEFAKQGIKGLDAYHLASAERGADVLITVDKRFLKRAKRIPNLKVKVMNPIEFLEEYYANKNGR